MAEEFIFGTAGLHRIHWHPARLRLLRLAIDTGFRAIDTAPLYGNGLAELALGQALGGDRARVAVTTKFGIPTAFYGATRPWTFAAERAARMVLDRGYRAAFDQRIWTPNQMRLDLEGSLRRLKTDHIERFCLHEPLDILPMSVWDDLCAVAQTLKAQGKIGAFGVSGEQACMSSFAMRPGLDFVQIRVTAVSGLGAFAGPVFAYGLYGHSKAVGHNDFNAYLRTDPGGPTVSAYLLSSTRPCSVAAYAPLFG